MQVFIGVCVSITGGIKMQILKNRKWKNLLDKMYIRTHIVCILFKKE